MTHLDQVDAKELGEAIDMIKDIEEAIYYKTVTEAMHQKEWEYKDESHKYYGGRYPKGEDWGYPRYDNGKSSPKENETGEPHHERDWEVVHDPKEGRSPRSRKMYMESKEQHHDKSAQMRELENYMQELTNDVVEMVEGATQEEKQYLSKRVAALANKLAQLND
jgi:hypothetical protein